MAPRSLPLLVPLLLLLALVVSPLASVSAASVHFRSPCPGADCSRPAAASTSDASDAQSTAAVGHSPTPLQVEQDSDAEDDDDDDDEEREDDTDSEDSIETAITDELNPIIPHQEAREFPLPGQSQNSFHEQIKVSSATGYEGVDIATTTSEKPTDNPAAPVAVILPRTSLPTMPDDHGPTAAEQAAIGLIAGSTSAVSSFTGVLGEPELTDSASVGATLEPASERDEEEEDDDDDEDLDVEEVEGEDSELEDINDDNAEHINIASDAPSDLSISAHKSAIEADSL